MPTEDALAAFVDEYLTHLRVERGLAANTLAAYRRDLTRYADFLTGRGIRRPVEVSPTDVSEFARTLAAGGLASSSVARMVVAVRGLHRFGLADGITDADPSAEVTPARAGERLPKALDVDQVLRLLAAVEPDTATGLRDAALLELLYGTGARVSEVCALDVDDLRPALSDADAGVRLLGKGGKQRVVPVGSHARAAVEAWLVRGRPGWAGRAAAASAALLLNSRGGRLSRQSAFHVLTAAAERAHLGVPVSPHSLRHSFATHLLDGGADVRVVQELLGHASVTTTQIYTKVTVEHLREVYVSAHPRAR